MNPSPETANPCSLMAMALVEDRDTATAEDACRATSAPTAGSLGMENQGGERDRPIDFRGWTQRITRGEEAAFTEFYERYSLRLYRHLLLVANGNELEAREVLQTVVVKLASKFKVFNQESEMWSWLSRLAKNAYIDSWRARQRGQRFVALEPCHDQLADRWEERPDWAESLRSALAALPDAEQELMRAAYVDRQSLQELADASGQTYKAVESRLARLRQKLKAQLLSGLHRENRA
jgi:RNA polymerase sigma factor (sigma-70 family)